MPSETVSKIHLVDLAGRLVNLFKIQLKLYTAQYYPTLLDRISSILRHSEKQENKTLLRLYMLMQIRIEMFTVQCYCLV